MRGGTAGRTAGELPVEGLGVRRRGTGELHGQWRTAAGHVRREAGGGRRHDNDGLGNDLVAAAVGGRQRHRISAVGRVGMGRIGGGAGGVVPEIPGVRRGIAGGVGKRRRRTRYRTAEGGGGRGGHHDQVGLRGGVAARRIAHRERDGIRAGGVVDHRRVLRGGTAGRTAGELPVEGLGVRRRGAGKLHGQWRTAAGHVRRKTGGGRRSNDHGMGDGRGTAAVGGGQRYRISAIGRVGMGRIGGGAGGVVPKIPGIGGGAEGSPDRGGVGKGRGRAGHRAAERRSGPTVHGHIIGLGRRAATRRIGRRQRDGVRAGRVVHHAWIGCAGGARRTTGELPAIGGGASRRLVGELHRERPAATGGRRREGSDGRGDQDDRLGIGHRAASIDGGEDDGIGAARRVGMAGAQLGARAAVAEVPAGRSSVHGSIGEIYRQAIYHVGKGGGRQVLHHYITGFRERRGTRSITGRQSDWKHAAGGINDGGILLCRL